LFADFTLLFLFIFSIPALFILVEFIGSDSEASLVAVNGLAWAASITLVGVYMTMMIPAVRFLWLASSVSILGIIIREVKILYLGRTWQLKKEGVLRAPKLRFLYSFLFRIFWVLPIMLIVWILPSGIQLLELAIVVIVVALTAHEHFFLYK
jgi:hypothetical protein